MRPAGNGDRGAHPHCVSGHAYPSHHQRSVRTLGLVCRGIDGALHPWGMRTHCPHHRCPTSRSGLPASACAQACSVDGACSPRLHPQPPPAQHDPRTETPHSTNPAAREPQKERERGCVCVDHASLARSRRLVLCWCCMLEVHRVKCSQKRAMIPGASTWPLPHSELN